jgi:hypothetical protein
MGEVDKGCPDKGCSESREMQGLLVSNPIHAFYYLFFTDFSSKKLIRGHCHGVVTSGGNVTHKHFHGNEKVGS